MTNGYDQQRRTTAGAIESHNDMTEEMRRELANTYALQKGVIEEGEDLINDYHDAGVHDLRSVQSFVDGDKKNWEEAQKAIDDVSGWNLGRRGFLSALGITGASAAAGGVFAASRILGSPEMDYSVSNAEEFERFYEGLRTSQKKGIGLVYGDEEELFEESGRDIVAFEARDDGNPSTEPEYKLWVDFSDEDNEDIDDYNWQEWNRDDYNKFIESFGTRSQEERSGEKGYINTILEGDI